MTGGNSVNPRYTSSKNAFNRKSAWNQPKDQFNIPIKKIEEPSKLSKGLSAIANKLRRND